MWTAVESEEEEGAGSSATVNRPNTCETQLTEDRNSQTQLLITVEYNTDCNVIKQCDFEKNWVTKFCVIGKIVTYDVTDHAQK